MFPTVETVGYVSIMITKIKNSILGVLKGSEP